MLQPLLRPPAAPVPCLPPVAAACLQRMDLRAHAARARRCVPDRRRTKGPSRSRTTSLLARSACLVPRSRVFGRRVTTSRSALASRRRVPPLRARTSTRSARGRVRCTPSRRRHAAWPRQVAGEALAWKAGLSFAATQGLPHGLCYGREAV